jgi:hypothetical protein
MRSATYVASVQHVARMQCRVFPLYNIFHTLRRKGQTDRWRMQQAHGEDNGTDDAGGWSSAGLQSSTQSACDSSANPWMFH